MRLRLLFTLSVLMAMAAAQLHCDPVTQYEKDGQCCNMCSPGNKMLPLSTCTDPTCESCEKNEYQDKYTRDNKCKLQSYCDPNKNFEAAVHKSTKTKTTCMCKQGFHCSSKDCMTCVQDSACGPGFQVQLKGNQMHDTVCQKCPHGTYSNESSSDGVCKKWTECKAGHYLEQSGTDISDNKCVEMERSHLIVICIIPVLLACLIGLIFYMCRNKSTYVKGTSQDCVESLTTEDEMQREAIQELRTPVENEDELSVPEMSTEDHGITENGNCVAQELGKVEVLSRQESQTQTQGFYIV
ncbi:tumor necrosis factor receptor superfamily member 5 isoform X2 [Leuresthes tenuis]|uniref:tumor necrosis factor receptor superfamily member 5 isoform X2 n=1 Tax=Leuresthes tenuis TaxID=355514 RepID=UPI003B501614